MVIFSNAGNPPAEPVLSLLPIIDLVMIGNNEFIITVIIGNNLNCIVKLGNNDVITDVIIGNNECNHR